MNLFERGRYSAIYECIETIETLLAEIGKRIEQYPPSEARTSAESQLLAMALNIDNVGANVDVMAGVSEEIEEEPREPEIDVVYDRPEMHELTQPASLEPSGPWPTNSEPDYSSYYEEEEEQPEDFDNAAQKIEDESHYL